MKKHWYKLVRRFDDKFYSITAVPGRIPPYAVVYELGVTALPPMGMLLAFPTLYRASEFISSGTTPDDRFVVLGGSTSYAIKMESLCSNPNEEVMREFWQCAEMNLRHDINESVIYGTAWTMKAPKGTFALKDFTPHEVIEVMPQYYATLKGGK